MSPVPAPRRQIEPKEQALRAAIEQIADTLCYAVDGRFEFTVHPTIHDESVEKLGMLINFLLDTARRALSDLKGQNARLSEVDRLKSDFLANVSHELRTPLTLILAPLEHLVSRSTLEPDVRETLGRMRRNVIRLHALVDDLLDFSTLEAGKVHATLRRTALIPFARTLVEQSIDMATSRGIELLFRPEVDPGIVLIDRRMTEKILFNLIGNALKFTPIGGRVVVSIRERGEEIELEVVDTGIGIAADQLGLLFERFQQIDSSMKRRFPGTGLGLALVKEFAELMGGSVGVESSLDEGSRFFVRLPLNRAVIADPEGDDVRDTLLRARLTEITCNDGEREPAGNLAEGPVIVVAEDNDDLRAFLVELLSTEGRVFAARDGVQALEVIRAKRPDAIVTDVMMPRKDGFEVVAELKQDPELRTIPVLLLTARAGREAMIEGFESGADDYLCKPFTPSELRARVRVALRLRSMQADRERLLREQVAAQEAARQKEALLTRERAARFEAERLSRMKDEFLATLSHELRTPLNAIMGWAHLLRQGEGFSALDISEALTVIERNAAVQNQLICDLLDLSRIASGKVALDPQPVSLRSVTEAALHSVQLAAEAKQIRLLSQVGLEDAVIFGDPNRLQQVVWNVLSNAIKFTGTGGTVTVQLSQENENWQLAVSDTGIGISSDFLPYVFERFRQENASSSRRYGGLGIGLAIVRDLVELHGGTARAESEGGGTGSRFVLTFPRLVSEPLSRMRDCQSDARVGREQRLTGFSVLVVDDDIDGREFVRRLLEREDARVVNAASAEEALNWLSTASFDVVIADIGMPGMDGYELRREIDARGLRHAVTGGSIALTAFARTEDREEALRSGYDAHLPKPVTPATLIEMVRDVIKH